MAGPLHLVRRFLGSLRPGGPPPVDTAWVASNLSAGELTVWASMPGPDRRHSVVVARDVDLRLDGASREVLAAALLHDCGKTESRLRTPGRVAATLALQVPRFDRARVLKWADASGWRGRASRYARHPELGAQLLSAVGSDPLTIAWTAQHHRSPERCTLDPVVAGALRAADDD